MQGIQVFGCACMDCMTSHVWIKVIAPGSGMLLLSVGRYARNSDIWVCMHGLHELPIHVRIKVAAPGSGAMGSVTSVIKMKHQQAYITDVYQISL